ncbi:hypothetical protein CC86DRAFT_372018 [Ophiobolus disseminans]|uniref:Uncharacterized protein n=1 Tax=Ophiobolus disseminans TaxID=1469910 RepID=A0A6A6ZSN9_9PLEO|nr:hypothetical protein CC86DRAFT_372018 [Ophiobolus disseminans]
MTSLPRLSAAASLLSARGAPSTPRERWDVLSRGPAIPLTPTPTGNAFATGGFWEQLTPKTPLPPTPVTAIPLSPHSPIVPQDLEARNAYDHVKHEVDTMARNICANRMSSLSKITDSNDIPKTLITAKDHLKGAAITLQYRQVDLNSIIDRDLPKKLQALATDEAKITNQYSVRDMLELLDIDTWLQVDEQTLNFTTLLDAQRELLQMHCQRRKTSVITLPDRAVQVAWAVRILEDAEHAAENDNDSESDHSSEDGTGYEYNNFLRSIKREATGSSSDLSSLADITSLRSTMSIGDSLRQLSREQSLESQRSSTSPKKYVLRSRQSSNSSRDPAAESRRPSTSPQKYSYLALRSQESSFSESSSQGPTMEDKRPSSTSKIANAFTSRSRQNSIPNAPSSRKDSMPNTPSPEKDATIHSRKPSNIITDIEEEEDEADPPPPLSPEDRACRRKGASHDELNQWAAQLKLMEQQRDAKKLSGHHRPSQQLQHPALRTEDDERSRDASDGSWKCAIASHHKRETSLSTRRSSRDISPRTKLRLSAPPTRPISTVSTRNSPPSPARPSFEYDYILSAPPAAPPGYRYEAVSASPPVDIKLHDSVRRKEHVRSKSSVEEVEWEWELRKMEVTERARQMKRRSEREE